MDKGIVFLGMGFELITVAVGGYFLGDTIDKYMGWHGVVAIYLVLALMVGWFFHLFILLRKFERDLRDLEEAEKHERKP